MCLANGDLPTQSFLLGKIILLNTDLVLGIKLHPE